MSQEAINSAIQSLEDPLQRVSVRHPRASWPWKPRPRSPVSVLLFLLRGCRNSSRSVWRWIPGSDPPPRSSCSIRPCSRCPYSSCWLPTASSATSVRARARKHAPLPVPLGSRQRCFCFENPKGGAGPRDDGFSLCFLADMIPENALEEMTKNMDPNLVIVEAKNGVQMK